MQKQNSMEFICITETAATTQKLIRTWVSSGYTITLVAQSSAHIPGEGLVITTSLWRTR